MSGNRKARGDSDAPIPRRQKPDADRCDLSFEVDLSGVNAALLRAITVGSPLDVSIIRVQGFETAACTPPGGRDVVGTLAAFEGLADLIECIKLRNVYTATVVFFDRGTCRVAIRRVAA
jgi:hypothetical protein